MEFKLLTKNLRLLLLACLAIVLSLPSAIASGPSTRFEQLSIEHGLPQSSAKAIIQDQQGFLWVGTEEGLARYDGYEFKVFKNNSDSSESISNNYVTALFEDKRGYIWIGTRNGGLNRFNPITEKFVHYQHQPNNSNSLSGNSIHAIAQDLQENIWIGTNGAGLNRFNSKTEKFTQFRHKTKNLNSLSSDSISEITVDKNGHLWIGTWGGGLNYFNTDTQQFTHYNHQNSDPHSLSNNTVTAIVEDKHGNFWLGTLGGGLNYFNPKTNHFTHYRNQSTNLNSLSNDIIRDIIYDQQGNLWIGTDGGGLNRLNSLTKHFTHYRHQDSNPNSLSNNIIRAITEDHKGNLWVGTWGGGLNRFNSETRQFTHFRSDPQNPNALNDDKIYVITEDQHNNLWIGTDSRGVNVFDPTTKTFRHYRHDPNDTNSLSDNAVSAITEDKQGNIWLGTWKGLNKFNPSTQTFTHYKKEQSNPNSLSNNSVRVITLDSKGNLWLGTWGGLNHFNPKTEQFTHYKHLESDPNSLSNNTIYSIKEDQQGNLWVGTASGLNLLDTKTGKFTHFFEEDGLANNVVYRIEEGHNEDIWLSTNLGLSNFNLKTNTFKNYNMGDGLQSNEFNADASFKNEQGELFFGGINGFNRFFPDKIEANTQYPKVTFTDMLLSNQSVPVSSSEMVDSNHTQIIKNALNNKYSLTQAIHSTSDIILTHQQNLVTFEFSTLHFSNPTKNQYTYKMDGFDKQWIKTDYKNRRATYTNLPTGSYILRVRASNPYGIWNEEGASLNITVLPPPWFSWWAYTLYFITAIVIALYFVRAQRNKITFIQKINEELEMKVVERTLGLQKANEELAKISVTDELTGLKNRRFVTNHLKSDIDLILRKNRTLNAEGVTVDLNNNESDLIFFLIDLDNFKLVNDIYGHSAGDSVLMQIKSILTKVFRETDYLVRWGGEEFLVVARFSDRRNAAALAEKLRKSVEMHDFVIDENTILNKTCSIGFASFPFVINNPTGLSWERVLDIADHCLYAAKHSAKNTWVGLENISCVDEDLFTSITRNTNDLIDRKLLEVKSSLPEQSKIKWNEY